MEHHERPQRTYKLQSVAYHAAGNHVYSPRIDIDVGNGGPIAYVVTTAGVTPINTALHLASPSITVGSDPRGIAVTPDGKTAYVTNAGSDSVTPINLSADIPGPPTAVDSNPVGIAITPDGATA